MIRSAQIVVLLFSLMLSADAGALCSINPARYLSGFGADVRGVLYSAVRAIGAGNGFVPSVQSEPAVENVKKKKKNQLRDQENYQKNADARIVDKAREIEEKKEGQQELSGSDRVRSISLEKTEEKKLERERNEEIYSRKGRTGITENEMRIEERKKRRELRRGESRFRQMLLRLKAKWESARLKNQDERRAAEQRIKNSQLRARQKKERDDELKRGLNSNSGRNARRIENKKKDIEIDQKEKELESYNERFEARKQVYKKKAGTPKSESDYLPVPGTESLKEGVTESSYRMGNKMVTERVVKVGNRVDKYKKVVSKTSIYYFCNDRSITEEAWRKATLAQSE
jgi:hypothetical protein